MTTSKLPLLDAQPVREPATVPKLAQVVAEAVLDAERLHVSSKHRLDRAARDVDGRTESPRPRCFSAWLGSGSYAILATGAAPPRKLALHPDPDKLSLGPGRMNWSTRGQIHLCPPKQAIDRYKDGELRGE